jgi:hypothetical protein
MIVREKMGNSGMSGGKHFETTKHELELQVLTMNSKWRNTTLHKNGKDVSRDRETQSLTDRAENERLEMMKLCICRGPKNETISDARPNKRHNKNNNRRGRRRTERGNTTTNVVHKRENTFNNLSIL